METVAGELPPPVLDIDLKIIDRARREAGATATAPRDSSITAAGKISVRMFVRNNSKTVKAKGTCTVVLGITAVILGIKYDRTIVQPRVSPSRLSFFIFVVIRHHQSTMKFIELALVLLFVIPTTSFMPSCPKVFRSVNLSRGSIKLRMALNYNDPVVIEELKKTEVRSMHQRNHFTAAPFLSCHHQS